MREVSQERSVQVKLRSSARANQSKHIALLESYGFTADRYFLSMAQADNSNAAGRLYESVGFHKLYTQIVYVKDV